MTAGYNDGMSWTDTLKRAAKSRANREGIAAVARQASIPRETLSRFLSGVRGLTLPAAESLAGVVGYHLKKKL